MYIVVGLGNPGEAYARTRHNTGRMAENYIAKSGKINARFVFLDTFMNKSGQGVVKMVKSKKAAGKLIVIHDDLDLPLGALKVSYNRSSGGHRGVESIIRSLKTREFIRIRIGIGKKENIEKHILGQFKKSELELLKKVFKKALGAVETTVEKGPAAAMTKFNS